MTFEEFRNEWNNDKDFIIVKTSGSTGVPKEIKLDKEFIKESALRTNKFFSLNEKSRYHSCVGADYIGGKMMLVRSILAEGVFTWENPSNRPLQGLKKDERIDLLAVVPSQMAYILENMQELPEIKNIIIGGSAIHPHLRIKIANSRLIAFETYGMTETASHIALRRIEEKEKPFVLFPGLKISRNEEGCLRILFRGNGEINTNDLVEIISDKEFFIRGRKDNVIISGGKKINPLDLENRVSHLIGNAFYFYGEPDPKWGQRLELVIEGDEKDLDGEWLQNEMGKILQRWEMPKAIRFQSNFPRTSNGKIIRCS